MHIIIAYVYFLLPQIFITYVLHFFAAADVWVSLRVNVVICGRTFLLLLLFFK